MSRPLVASQVRQIPHESLLAVQLVSASCRVIGKWLGDKNEPSLHLTLLHRARAHAGTTLSHRHAIRIGVVLVVSRNLLHCHSRDALRL